MQTALASAAATPRSGRKAPSLLAEATLIHVFSTDELRQSSLLAVLRRLADEVLAQHAGFRGATLARSLDGERIVLETVWDTLPAARIAVLAPAARPMWLRASALAAREADVHVYDSALQLYSVGTPAGG